MQDRNNYALFSPVVLLAFWPIVGFCFGQILGLLARRTIIAAFLALVFAASIAAAWALSILIGDVTVVWVLVIPLLLLLSSWFLMRPWAAGRLTARRPIIGIGVVGVLTALTVSAFIWNRANEVPDVGEPFDVKTFIKTLPPVEKNEAGTGIRRAIVKFAEHRQNVEKRLGPPKGPAFPIELTPWWGNGGEPTYVMYQSDILELGWPSNDKEINPWLDQVFQDKSADELQKAVRLPLGLVQDPRLVESTSSLWDTAFRCERVAHLFIVRALQLQARGDSRGALNHLETVFALIRQMRNNAPLPLFIVGSQIQTSAITGYKHWLQMASSDKQLLLDGQAMLERHRSLSPELVNSIKAQYLVDGCDNFRERPQKETLLDQLQYFAAEAPWEKERRLRIINAATLGVIRSSQLPEWQRPGENRRS